MKPDQKESIYQLFTGLSTGSEKGGVLYQKHREAIDQALPEDVIEAVDRMVQEEIPMERMKKGISKALNLLHNRLHELPEPEVRPGGFFDHLKQNNQKLDQHLKNLRPIIRETQDKKAEFQPEAWERLHHGISELLTFTVAYEIAENILFPVFEKHNHDYRCVSVMWSIHDDIRRNLRAADELVRGVLSRQSPPADNRLNELLGDLYFDMYAIKFRVERILIPAILQKNGEAAYTRAWQDALNLSQTLAGGLHPDMVDLIFRHLPVDVTYVNENDEVVFYSDPPHRIFPRTPAVIGRKVQNCHPRESLGVVNQIIDAFRKGEKDDAIFWIDMKGRKIQIAYYAVREQGAYRGVLEVGHDITELRNRDGERRLLDW